MKANYAPTLQKNMMANNIEILHRHLLTLPMRQQLAIQLRFWENCSIAQVAWIMEVSWNEADRLIESAVESLRKKLLNTQKETFAAIAA